MTTMMTTEITIPIRGGELPGLLAISPGAAGIVVFAHGSGSSRLSPRNREVATVLQDAGLGTLLFDLLTADEAQVDERTRQHRFDIPLLGQRLVAAIDWLRREEDTRALPIGCFGASTGAAAALAAAAARPDDVAAVVSRGGRPDLAGEVLPDVHAPTLLIVGALDTTVIGMNESAQARMTADTELVIVPGATHLFEEPGTMDRVTELATSWLSRHLAT